MAKLFTFNTEHANAVPVSTYREGKEARVDGLFAVEASGFEVREIETAGSGTITRVSCMIRATTNAQKGMVVSLFANWVMEFQDKDDGSPNYGGASGLVIFLQQSGVDPRLWTTGTSIDLDKLVANFGQGGKRFNGHALIRSGVPDAPDKQKYRRFLSFRSTPDKSGVWGMIAILPNTAPAKTTYAGSSADDDDADIPF